jgi:hypothetical protein
MRPDEVQELENLHLTMFCRTFDSTAMVNKASIINELMARAGNIAQTFGGESKKNFIRDELFHYDSDVTSGSFADYTTVRRMKFQKRAYVVLRASTTEGDRKDFLKELDGDQFCNFDMKIVSNVAVKEGMLEHVDKIKGLLKDHCLDFLSAHT